MTIHTLREELRQTLDALSNEQAIEVLRSWKSEIESELFRRLAEISRCKDCDD